MYVSKESVNEHFKKPIKNYGRGSFIKKIEINIIKKLGRNVICFL